MGSYYGYPNRPALVAELTTRWQSGEKYMETVAHTLRGNVLWAVHRWVDVEGQVIQRQMIGVGISFMPICCKCMVVIGDTNRWRNPAAQSITPVR